MSPNPSPKVPTAPPLSESALAAIEAVKANPNTSPVYFLGSAVSIFAPTSLPTWLTFIKQVVQSLAEATNSEDSDPGNSGNNGNSRAQASQSRAKQRQQRKVAELVTRLHGCLNESVLPPYKATEVMARRLGSHYLSVVEVFQDAPPNPVHTWIASELFEGAVPAVVTTNFDDAVESAYRALGGDVYTLTGDLAHDKRALERLRKSFGHRRVLLVVANPDSFQLFMRYFTVSLGSDSMSFLFKIHGDCYAPQTCIDTESQRIQGLSSYVTSVLSLLLRKFTMTFLGFSGADLAEYPDYIRMISEADVADVLWVIREDVEPPFFEAFRKKLGDHFQVRQGQINGKFAPNETITGKLAAWAAEKIGPLRSRLVLFDLAKLAGLAPHLYACLTPSSILAAANPAVGGLTKSNSALAFLENISSFSFYTEAKLDKEFDQVKVSESIIEGNLVDEHIQRFLRNQTELIKLAQLTIEQLEQGDVTKALQMILRAIQLRQENFPDSRYFIDSCFLLIIYGVVLESVGESNLAMIVFEDAQNVAYLCGNVHGMKLSEEILQSRKDKLKSAAIHSEAADLAHPSKTGAEHGELLPSTAGLADETLLFLPAFDNVAALSSGVPMRLLLRAHLHRALITGDRVAIAGNFLLNSRVFVLEVLVNDSGEELNHEYLHYIRPMLPRSQSVKIDGANKLIDIQGSSTPLLTYRRDCQVNNPGYLSEIIPEWAIERIDEYYQAHPELIFWYDFKDISGTYASRMQDLINNGVTEARATLERHGVHPEDRPLSPDPGSGRLSPHADTPVESSHGHGTASRSGRDVEIETAAVQYDIFASMKTFVGLCLSQGYLTRSQIYDFGNLFIDPLSNEGFKTKYAALLAKCSDSERENLLRVRTKFIERRWVYADTMKRIADAPYVLNLPITFACTLCVDQEDLSLIETLKASLNNSTDTTFQFLDHLSVGPIRVFELGRLSVADILQVRSTRQAKEFRRHLGGLRRGTQMDYTTLHEAARGLYESIQSKIERVDARPLFSLDWVNFEKKLEPDLSLVRKIVFVINQSVPVLPLYDIPNLDFPSLIPMMRIDNPMLSVAGVAQPVECVEQQVLFDNQGSGGVALRLDRIRNIHEHNDEFVVPVVAHAPERVQAVIVAVRGDGLIGLVRKYHYAVQGWSLECPRGEIDVSGDVETQISQELARSASLGAERQQLVRLSKESADLWTNNQVSDAKTLFYAALDVCAIERPETDDQAGAATATAATAAAKQDNGVLWLPYGEIGYLIREGEIRDQATVAALTMASLDTEVLARISDP
ncbi:uncharacterized protein BJ171DRAFT_601543 [Polychytrium aggregatum]|uniref:uncharacterized protein n=1 Tax=Polychytrium aggregatum TaxID=110093 RepID=UPI0022FDBD40|nr:uncharacterized protein BJ171DRAFT_601543 [Polychytrium aggregatum]KAI9199849.1 hypothetical protein BJ171DRAFT_601543 [Polychytrium aggregatum]